MKLKCLFLLLLLGISFCVHAQKRPVILEKQLEIIRKGSSFFWLFFPVRSSFVLVLGRYMNRVGVEDF